MEIFIVLWLLSAGLCAYIGNEKGRDVFGWGLAGFLFGVFAIIAVCAVPSLKDKGV